MFMSVFIVYILLTYTYTSVYIYVYIHVHVYSWNVIDFFYHRINCTLADNFLIFIII